MAIRNILKMRILRKYVKSKDAILFMTGILILFCCGVGVYHISRWCINSVRYCYHVYILDDVNDAYNQSFDLNHDYRFYENGSHSYIRNKHTGEKVLKDICWIAGVEREDSLLCYASGGYRGYFNRITGHIAIPADRYKKAWLFSEGLAAVVDEENTLKFINPEGEVVVDKNFKLTTSSPNQIYMFKNGFCPISGINHCWGLIDSSGKWVVVPEYEHIEYAEQKSWICYKDGKQGLLNDSLHLVIKPEYREVLVTDMGVEVLKQDYTRQLLDYNGNIIEQYLYTDVRELYYKSKVVDPDVEAYEYVLSPYKEYQTTYSSNSPTRVGLMDGDGRLVTPPLYASIKAVGADCFRCFYSQTDVFDDTEGASILINGKGQIIK